MATNGRLTVSARRLAPGPERREGRVDEDDALPGLDDVSDARPPRLHLAVRPVGLLEFGPALPRGDRPQEDALVLVDHRRLPRPGQLPAVAGTEGGGPVLHALQELVGRAVAHDDLLVGVALAAHARRAQLGDRPCPRCRLEDAVLAAAAELRRLGPPLLERRILRSLAHGFDAERLRQAVPSVVLPDVDDRGPSPRRAEHGPDPVAELLALLLGLGAPIGGHVVHVGG